MYSYTYSQKTGGILLNSTPTGFSKEPRPVYAAELDLLGFDKFWEYDKQNDIPYMWAEANAYWYRGVCVAKLKGGNLFNAPEIIIPVNDNGESILPEPNGKALQVVDVNAMVESNREMLDIIEQSTVKKIISVYTKYKDKLDLFHVAFSGGKDSAVLLDLVKKALPLGSFVVVFGDTGMEFPDTYDVIDKTRQMCEADGIPFYIAKSSLEPQESWVLFGPPSRALRWCCGVHKSAPQTLKLRAVTGKNDYTGLAFVGVRSEESAKRAEYDYENYSKKQRGQYSHNSILEWTSAEVWLYLYANNIMINEAYKKGNARAGCLFCPMSVKKADFVKQQIYPREIKTYLDIIKKSNGRDFGGNSYLADGGWVSRRSGRDLIDNVMNCSETLKDGMLTIKVTSPRSDWREWIKTLGNFEDIPFTIEQQSNNYLVKLPESYINKNPTFRKLFKQVFRKSAYCVKCGVCESNCNSGRITFDNELKITNCEHCLKCHDIVDGCLAYNSLRIPTEEKAMSINCFDSVLPKNDWFNRFFNEKNDFWNDHGLGPNQLKTFKRFLKDAGLTEKNNYTALAEQIAALGWETNTAWGILLINLATDNPQIRWYISNLEIGMNYPRETVISMLLESNSSNNVVKFVYSAFGKLMELPLGATLRFGYVTNEGNIARTKCSISDLRVILYGLFKFAEKCNNYKEFTLASLISNGIDRDGISPTRIFGLDREDVTPMLLGLSTKYPEFITVSFTHDLEKITLADYKTSADVIELFSEDSGNEQ
ncbi:phosphoadenosine phosphosulfate reductase [Denitrovibrio acetiphilus DSM 12809]|uniref:Phosphoadenosine phosphosulfate reductase n=1 Tax=Denitrovibrio acetiphilus (strain DSM 12809 / NBRC 114555 / N2460) TaxID=522772 RepID=D4H458_DENA2|nr:phosphoadenosine phosphosulfate reductase family protein [Denitrovibrio acetiphilus]ADD67369.1 phosphoadenosine phosphosulfate reductase [Denitrovibrio acetiphilus DSM 12809]